MFDNLMSTLKQFITPYPISPDAPELKETVATYIEEVVLRLHSDAWVQHITAPDYVWMHDQWVFRVNAETGCLGEYHEGDVDCDASYGELDFTFYFLPHGDFAFSRPVKGTDLFLAGEC
tara:strand:+ start:538 stop:894 length:357 start_codon:yes stop_codon:yes gene_type:complete